MNILIDKVPKSVYIEGKKYEINSDFRTSILFELLMQDSSIPEETKVYNALNLYYPICPENISEAVDKILWFYKCGKEEEGNNSKTSKSSKANKNKIAYSFEFDDEYIYAAFLTQYNIDLQDINYLHWWKFRALFKALKEDNEIVKIMGYRTMDLSKISDKEQRKHYESLQELYKLPEIINNEDEERRKAIEDALLNGENIEDLL